MEDLLVGLGLVLVVEGLIWALAPSMGKSMLETAAAMPQQALRFFGTSAVAVGVLIVWLVRG